MKVIEFAVWPNGVEHQNFWRGRRADYIAKIWDGVMEYRLIYGCRITPHRGRIVRWLLPRKKSS